MQFTIPTTKTEMMNTLQEIFYYYRIRRENYEELTLTDLSLDRLEFTPLTDEELEEKAEILVSAEQSEKLMKYQEDLNEQIVKKTKEITAKQTALSSEITAITSRYQTSEATVEDRARKNGLSASNIILDKLAELEAKKNAEISGVTTKYNAEIATLSAEKTALQTRLTNASTYFDGLFASEVAVKKQELSDAQEKTAMEVFKYNNSLDEKEKNSANNNIKANASLQMKYMELKGEFYTKDQLVEMGYYNDVIDCVCGYYDTLSALTAYNDFRQTPKLAIYLDDYYDDILYLYGSRV